MSKKENMRFVTAVIISLFSLCFAVWFLRLGIASIGLEMGGAENGFAFAVEIMAMFGLLFVQLIGIAVACGLLLGAFLAHSFRHHENGRVRLASRVMLAADAVFAAAVIITDVLMITV